MAIDTTPSQVATSALQAIPFGSMIGGPLNACIEAQAMAAQTSGDRGTGHCPGWFKIVFEILEMIFLPIPVSRWS